MTAQATLGVAENVATEILALDGEGLLKVDIINKGTTSLVASYYRKSTGKSVASSLDTKYTGEQVWDGDVILNTPVAPGSLFFTKTGAPTLTDRDKDGILRINRTVGSVLLSASNGATSVPATRTLTSAGNNFTTSGVVAGDKVILSGGDAYGEYTAVTVGTTTVVLDKNFPQGSLSSLSFRCIAVDLNCGYINYFSGAVNFTYPSSPSTASPANKGSVKGTVVFPINLNPADTLVIDVDATGDATATFDADNAERQGNMEGVTGASLAASNSEVLSLKVDAESVAQSITFGAGSETTAALYAAVVSTQIVGGYAVANADSLVAMIGSVNELRVQYIAHGASAVIHPVADGVNLITAPLATDLTTARALAKDIKDRYNAHQTEATVHTNNDPANAITAIDATNLAELVTLVAELKLDINAHMIAASVLEESIAILVELTTDFTAHMADTTSHDAADVTNALAYGAPTTLGTALLSANDIKVKYNFHRSDAGHPNSDAGNEITAVDATTAGTLVTLVNELKLDFNAHMIAASELEECITLVTELLNDYAAHIIDTSSHVIADVVQTPASVAAPTNYAECVTRTQDLTTKYNAHRSQAGVHVNNDAGNDVTATSPATTQAELELLCNDLRTSYNTHLLETSNVDEAIILVNEVYNDYEAHRVDVTPVHGAADNTNIVNVALYPCTDLASANLLCTDIKNEYEAHRVLLGGVHDHADAANAIGSADATTVGTLTTLANELKLDINLHMVSLSEEDECVALVNDLYDMYEAHRILVGGGEHGGADATNVVNPALYPATDLASGILLATEIETQYSAHIVFLGGGCHGNFDSVNEVTAGAATTLATLATLLNDIRVQYEAHRIYEGANATVWGTSDFTATGITDTANPFTADDVGKQIITTNATSGGNNGTFLITGVPGAGEILYTNAASVIEAFVAPTTGVIDAVHLVAGGDVTNVMTATAVNTADIHKQDDTSNTIGSPSVEAASIHYIDDIINTLGAVAVGTAAVHIIDDVTNTIAAADAETAGIHSIDDTVNTIVSMPDSIEMFSDTFGTGSSIEIVSGTGTLLAKIGHVAGTSIGTGDVDDIDAVSFAEAKALIEADVSDTLCTLDDDSTLRITSDAATEDAASSINVNATSTAEVKFGLSTTIQTGADATANQAVSAAYLKGTTIAAQGRSTQYLSMRAFDQVKMYCAASGGAGKVNVTASIQL